jgi:hypothetical protein
MRTREFARAAALALALAFPVAMLGGADAMASVSVAVSWDGLLALSTNAVVVTPTESLSVWEGGRIYTYTRVRVDRAVAGDLSAGSEAWVRTMGGIVGPIGQAVEGEAVLAPGLSCLLFLRPGPAGTFEVTARGQGQYAVVADDPSLPPRIARSHAVGMLVPRRPPSPALPQRLAVDVLHGKTVDDAAREVSSAWGPLHAK